MCECEFKVTGAGVVKIPAAPGGPLPVFPTGQQLLLPLACTERGEGSWLRGGPGLDWRPPFRGQPLLLPEFHTASGYGWKAHESFPPSRSRSKFCYPNFVAPRINKGNGLISVDRESETNSNLGSDVRLALGL